MATVFTALLIAMCCGIAATDTANSTTNIEQIKRILFKVGDKLKYLYPIIAVRQNLG